MLYDTRVLLLAGIVAIVIGLERSRSARRAGDARWRPWLAVPVAGLVLVALGAPRGLMLTKSLGVLAMPLGLVWTGLLALALFAWCKARRRECAVLAASWLALTLTGNDYVADALCRYVEGEHARARPFDGGRYDAIVVLGGGTDGRPGGVQLGASGDRVVLAARLYHAGATPRLVTSGSPLPGLSDHDAAAATRRIWRELGIPDESIVVVEGARTTSEEARLHAALIRERGWSRVGLVTSALHMRRARGLFESEGVDVTPLPADVRGKPPEWHGFYSLVPQGTAAWRIHSACWEIVGRLAGR